MNRKEHVIEQINYLSHIISSHDLSTEEVYWIECELDNLSNELDRIEREEE